MQSHVIDESVDLGENRRTGTASIHAPVLYARIDSLKILLTLQKFLTSHQIGVVEYYLLLSVLFTVQLHLDWLHGEFNFGPMFSASFVDLFLFIWAHLFQSGRFFIV